MATVLTAQSIVGFKPRPTPYYVSDALVPGLQLRIATDGSKTWSLLGGLGTPPERGRVIAEELTCRPTHAETTTGGASTRPRRRTSESVIYGLLLGSTTKVPFQLNNWRIT
jgi:hypothetical protein